MPYCRECGKKYDKMPKFCNECGIELSIKSKETSKKVEEQQMEQPLKREFITEKPRKASMGWVWLILIIVIVFIVIMSLEQGGVSVSSRTEKGFLSSTHETTKCGIYGCKTEKKSCPFWDRDC